MTEQEFLAAYDITQYPRPSLTADILTFGLSRNQKDVRKIPIDGIQILLVNRAEHPDMGKWALPGGFVRPDETVNHAALRVLETETGVTANLNLINTYSEPGRDPRGWIVSNAFYGMVDKTACSLRTDKQAWNARWFTLIDHQKTNLGTSGNITTAIHSYTFQDETDTESFTIKVQTQTRIHGTQVQTLSKMLSKELAFDHDLILFETMEKLRQTIKHDIRALFDLFPDSFTISELRMAYQLITGIDDANFRRTVKNYVIETTQEATAGYRPPKLYKRNPAMFL